MTADLVNDPSLDTCTWLVGSGDDCDVVIDHPRVSRHHCEITRDGDHLSIQDVNSEHGTWIEDFPVAGPRKIRRGQKIRLGQTVELIWPSELESFKSVVTIGRSARADVVLDKPNISGLHARLIDDGQSLWIEDMGSTNGVALQRPDNLVQHERVVPEDPIYLGSTRITIDRILQLGLSNEGIDNQAIAHRLADKMLENARASEAQRSRLQTQRTALLTCIAVASLLAGAAAAIYHAGGIWPAETNTNQPATEPQ